MTFAKILAQIALIAGLLTAGPVALASERAGLPAFTSMAELTAFLDAHASQDPQDITCPPENPDCLVDVTEEVGDIIVTGSRASTPSITNNQEAGVDEGDIVKARGDTLVILRRGRLFTVDTGQGRLRLVDRADAYPPGAEATGDWYDEMLVAGDRVIVIGYSYERGGTEINRFRLDAAGRLTFEDSHHLASEDYYSSRNYASRLVGDQLVVYSPVDPETGDPLKDLPRLTRWTPDAEGQEDRADDYEDMPGRPIVTPGDVYQAPGVGEGSRSLVFHTVVRCPLSAEELTCRATAILGPGSRSFYVAQTAVYVWMAESEWALPKGDLPRSWLYRVPLDGGRPQAAATVGAPIDQFSFLEEPELERINVLVVANDGGDAMWSSEHTGGGAALLQLPFSRFGDGEAEADFADYRILPGLAEGRAQNRFVGAFLLYSSSTWSRLNAYDRTAPRYESRLFAVPLALGPTQSWGVPGAVSRIEVMGPDALVVSGEEDVFFTTVDLQAPRPVISDQFVMVGSEETESRSHAFFFQPDLSSPDGSTGVLGLPVTRPRGGTEDDEDWGETVATITYMRRSSLGRLGDIGSLDAGEDRRRDDGCVASCYDWYGDARPIFLGDRIFALLGYELVEGRERAGRIREVRRVDMTPPTPPGPRPYYRDLD
ncbi:MAG: beta-propeller domain-containing protein [Brevundimonas sp.]|nr:beta-propeller domain-containing protein [Brevundimonas sp.]